MTGRITRQRDVESLKIAARWTGADKTTLVTLATRLAADRADAEGYRYFSDLSDAQPEAALPLALAGYFQARLGPDADTAPAPSPVPAPRWPSWTAPPRPTWACRSTCVDAL